MDEKAETRARILEAAGKRFMHYGYAKTTMSEIAADLKMSTGNLYRFYPSKLDIAEAQAREHEADDDALMHDIAHRDQPAATRLRDFHFALLNETFRVIDESKKVFELAQAITRERPSYANRRLATERIYLKVILQDGINEGQYAPHEDLEFVAEMIQCATMKFRYPQLHGCFNIDMLRRELAGTLDLICNGLNARA